MRFIRVLPVTDNQVSVELLTRHPAGEAATIGVDVAKAGSMRRGLKPTATFRKTGWS